MQEVDPDRCPDCDHSLWDCIGWLGRRPGSSCVRPVCRQRRPGIARLRSDYAGGLC